MTRGDIYIIPDENQILKDLFYRQIDKEHLMAIQEFSDQFRLGYKFKKGDYQMAPCIVAGDGHLVVKTVEDMSVLFYIPYKVTDRQSMWFYNNLEHFSKYQMIGGFRISSLSKDDEVENLNSLNDIIHAIDIGNILYNKELEDKSYVGKKI